jgi:haloalkane dehalogenase
MRIAPLLAPTMAKRYRLVESNLSGQITMPQMTRHYLTIAGPDGPRRVHYRKCGKGPPVLMVHQSPRSSAEYEALMQDWAGHFTCIAPDTPGFGQSDPLAKADPDINDYADAIVEFVGALGLDSVAAYGFHSGAIILVTALKRHPHVFRCIAAGGYAIWTPQEMAIFGERYIPPFLPSSYGEHLTWMWNRILEQSWFFPWFDVRGETRLSGAHDDPLRTHAIAMEMLDAGDAYRLGYGAVLRASRDIPPPDAITPPVLISAYAGDPLQDHIDRLGTMPAGWEACKVDSPKIHQDISRDFLAPHAGPARDDFAEDTNAGFITVETPGFAGLIHWKGARGNKQLALHAPGSEAELTDTASGIAIDLPGHGLSGAWPGEAPIAWPAWQAVVDAAAAQLRTSDIAFPDLPHGDPDRLFPDLTPDRFGAYLTKAWAIIRARSLFAPWYAVSATQAIPFDPESLAPVRLALHHRALIRATSARAMAVALTARG